MKTLKSVFALAMSALIVITATIYSGVYPFGADTPHNNLTYWLLDTARDRSVAVASKDIAVPDLQQVDLLIAGATDYNEMCSGCHLQPGQKSSEISLGLYPAPPNLSAVKSSEMKNETLAQRQFWTIKHGIKASGMPAWGLTHSDERIWAMVAFLQKLPHMTALQYQILSQAGISQEDSQGHH
ncbi:cytochrome c [Zhongshania sp.]|uniref:c-type cytochrome n=1 Tax=Zhongshania sp. TaxID=1971902 RepID=UPI0035617B87